MSVTRQNRLAEVVYARIQANWGIYEHDAGQDQLEQCETGRPSVSWRLERDQRTTSWVREDKN